MLGVGLRAGEVRWTEARGGRARPVVGGLGVVRETLGGLWLSLQVPDS